MKKLLLLSAALALFATWTAAQSQNNGQNATPNQASVRGCLTGAGGQYRLVDDNHVVYMVMGNDKQLSGFDGQQVEVTGKLEQRIQPKEEQTASSFSRPEQRLRVASISKISDTCNGASQ